MSRPLRIEYAGALYHVTSRGNERKPIYREEADFDLFLDVLTDVCKRFHWGNWGQVLILDIPKSRSTFITLSSFDQ